MTTEPTTVRTLADALNIDVTQIFAVAEDLSLRVSAEPDSELSAGDARQIVHAVDQWRDQVDAWQRDAEEMRLS